MSVRTVELNDDDIFKPEFDWFLQMVAKNTKGAFTDITGILTETQFATLMKKIRQRNGADLLNETSVTTLSGRQAQLQLDSAEATNDIPSAFFPHVYATNSTFTLDLVPYVYADGYTIQLNLIPTISEPTGYANPADPAPAIQRGNGGIPIMGNLPLPRTRVRQVVINCTVWDGQTAMLLLKPYVAHQKNVVIFVTATIIDPSGNRKNSEGSLPFAQKAVPPQTAH